MARGTLEFGVDLAYATVFSSSRSGDAATLFDMEVARIALRAAWGLGTGTEVGVEAPLLWMGAGLFDEVLIEYHQTFGFSSGDRDDAPRNRFAYEVTDGRDTYAPDPDERIGLGDLILGVKQRLAGRPGTSFSLAARGLLKLPTGRSSDGYGSGGADGSLGLVFAGRSGPFGFYGNLDGLYLGQSPDPALELGTQWAFSAMGAVTAQLWNLGDLTGQMHYFTTPYSTGIDAVDKDVVMLAVTFRQTTASGVTWGIGFTEDPAVESSPDVALIASVEYSFGGRP